MTGYLFMLLVPATLLTGSFVGRWKQRLAWRADLGFRVPSRSEALASLALFLALSVATELLYRHWGLNDTGQPWRLKYDVAALGIRVAFIGLVYPVAEEIFFRGFFFGLLRRRFGDLVGIAGSSMLFAALHLQYDLRGMFLVLVDAVFFGLVRSRTNSTILTIVLHVLGNSFAVWQRL